MSYFILLMLSMHRLFQNQSTFVVIYTFAFVVERMNVRRPNKCTIAIVTTSYDTAWLAMFNLQVYTVIHFMNE